jgi:hypothetical protein
MWDRTQFCKLQKGCTRLAAASDKVNQLLAQGWWFSPASSTTKIGRHDITEILRKVALSTKIQIKKNTTKNYRQSYSKISKLITNFLFTYTRKDRYNITMYQQKILGIH